MDETEEDLSRNQKDSSTPETNVEHLKNGIFNMVIHLVKEVEGAGIEKDMARGYAISYLQSLIEGLISTLSKDQEESDQGE